MTRKLALLIATFALLLTAAPVAATVPVPTGRIDVSPLTARNPLGSPHVVTATVQQDAGLGLTPVPNGTLVTFSLSHNIAGAQFVGPSTCTTTGGSCSITINAIPANGGQTGPVDISASSTFSVSGTSITVATGTTGNGANAEKIYDPAPAALPFSIGYWKNHASCTRSGNHLDTVLASFGGTLLVGDLTVDTCAEAVALLNKTSLTGGNMSSDPAFNFAAQYLAYRLNFQNGSGGTTATFAAASLGAAILAGIDFDGVTHLALTGGQRSALLQAAAILDAFNAGA